MRHLLVTNDFPPKDGGIQQYLWELWRRLPADEVTVLTTPHPDAARWDAEQAFRIERASASVLLPTPGLADRVRSLADEVGADLVLLDPALPLGHLGPRLGRPYGIVLHGAEVTVPGRTVLARRSLAKVLVGAEIVVAAGGYPADEGERAARRGLPVVVVPPGVDTERFRPASAAERAATRDAFDVAPDAELVVSISRLVPRKGMDVLIDAAARLRDRRPRLQVLIAGAGRDATRLQRRIDSTAAPVRLVGRIAEDDKPRLLAAADLFAMLCRDRWAGLEQEGFGIVFLEAAACGVAQVAGASGGAAEAVADGITGRVVADPTDVGAVAAAVEGFLDDPAARAAAGRAARVRAVEEFSYDGLARTLGSALDELRRPV
ncbi:glycosyltransferase family 4 protein [Iamia sp. SCSIO 61187]|uniref:glycosyltransferase family 4 protein n=1 Tax=Iamia sp. SCSIO 61187 TaxID=2722752 RepID=UPI001C634412|nr:glycosyltransferase family 4 protein [Iamia sp. SCSIO 61187]QYG92756.1 glycosyltransferase family 4 protein [Iamia sp. SCSIO 61187]